MNWSVSPAPPVVGPATVRITLHDPEGRPVRDARLRLEGHMAHPGMAPAVAGFREGDAGRYDAAITFTMGGDWVLLLTGELADGRRLRRQLDVPGVRSGQ